LGINAKMSELQAAMGLAILPYVTSEKKKEKMFLNFIKKPLRVLN
jgi:dTDP-4-amino-4,6-dideoxygalactose transaminase